MGKFCTINDELVCERCREKYRRKKTFAICRAATDNDRRAIKHQPKPKHRPRTAEEIESALLICIACEHRTPEGLCGLLKREGCGSCRTIADFSAKLRRGMGCPDGRFPATEVEVPDGLTSDNHV